MKCANCGSLVAGGLKECPSCGQPFTPPAGDAPRRGAESEDTAVAAGSASVVTIHNSRGPGGEDPPATGEPPDPLLGRVLAGRYRILSQLGHGGMGVVYKAEHVKLDRPVAIKVLNAELAHNPEFVSRFRREAQTASDIDHRNAVRIYDYGDEDDTLFIAMEYLDGQPLSALLKTEGTLSMGRAVRIARQAAAALEAAHQLGFVHRDFKPDNVMVCQPPGQPEVVKVVDFGIAKRVRVDPKFSSLTRTGYLVGTPQYMSPEQVIDDDPDQRSDLYSLALVTYEMITGQLPFGGASAQRVMVNRLVEQPKPMSAARPDMEIPAAVEAVILKALARERDGRYASTGEFADALEAAYAEATAPPRPAPPKPVEPELDRKSRWTLQNPAAVVAGLVFAVGIAAGAAVFVGRQGGGPALVNGRVAPDQLVANTAPPPSPPPAAEINTAAAPPRAADAAAALLGAVNAARLVTMTEDDAYSFYMRLREENPRHEALARVGADVLPRLLSMGEEIFRRKVSFDAEGLNDTDWLRTIRVYEWACLLSPADRRLEARRKFAEAEFAKRRNNREEAESKFSAAIQLDGSWALPQNSLGLLRADRKDYAAAITSYQQAARLQPDWAVPYNNLGAAYFNLKDYGSAAAWYRKAVERNPRWARPHVGLGAIYELERDVEGAVAEYRTALQLDPDGRLIDVAKVLDRIRQLEED